MRNRFVSVSVLALVIAMIPALPVAAQPSNDSFGDATVVGSMPFEESVDLTPASVEPGEPVDVCAPIANTVWYSLTLERTDTVLIDTAGSGFDTVLAVWQGDTFNDLELVKCVDDTAMGLESRILLSAEAGETYLVQAGGFGSVSAGSILSISIAEAPRMTGKPVVYKGSSRGNAAHAYLHEFDDKSYTSTSVFLFDGRTKYVRGKPYKAAEVGISRYSSSWDESTGVVTWEEWYGSAPMLPGTAQLDARLRSAWVSAEVTVSGLRCVQGPYEETEDGYYYESDCEYIDSLEVLVDVTWTGQGSTYRYSYSDRSSSADGYRGHYSSSTTARDADVAGIIGAGVEGWGVSMDVADGNLLKDSSRTMTVYRGVFAN